MKYRGTILKLVLLIVIIGAILLAIVNTQLGFDQVYNTTAVSETNIADILYVATIAGYGKLVSISFRCKFMDDYTNTFILHDVPREKMEYPSIGKRGQRVLIKYLRETGDDIETINQGGLLVKILTLKCNAAGTYISR